VTKSTGRPRSFTGGEVEAPGDARATVALLTALVAPIKGRIYWPELE